MRAAWPDTEVVSPWTRKELRACWWAHVAAGEDAGDAEKTADWWHDTLGLVVDRCPCPVARPDLFPVRLRDWAAQRTRRNPALLVPLWDGWREVGALALHHVAPAHGAPDTVTVLGCRRTQVDTEAGRGLRLLGGLTPPNVLAAARPGVVLVVDGVRDHWAAEALHRVWVAQVGADAMTSRAVGVLSLRAQRDLVAWLPRLRPQLEGVVFCPPVHDRGWAERTREAAELSQACASAGLHSTVLPWRAVLGRLGLGGARSLTLHGLVRERGAEAVAEAVSDVLCGPRVVDNAAA